jgi:hypothetical protein
MKEFEEFEKQFMFEVLKNPTYRLGQAFSNTFPDIANSMEQDGDNGYRASVKLWNTSDRKEVLEIIDWYIIK